MRLGREDAARARRRPDFPAVTPPARPAAPERRSAPDRAPAPYRDQQGETAFQEAVEDYAALNGWTLRFHDNDPRRNRAGWPDLVLARERTGEVLFVELKAARGRLSRDQRRWLAVLKAAGCRTYVWNPGDWPEIEQVLGRVTGRV